MFCSTSCILSSFERNSHTVTEYIYLEEEQVAFVSDKSGVIAMLKGTAWMGDANTFMIHI